MLVDDNTAEPISDFRREIKFEPGYDYTDEDFDKPPNHRRGRHGLNVRFVLHGEHGAVVWLLYTSWLPSWVGNHDDGEPYIFCSPKDLKLPTGANVGLHWDTNAGGSFLGLHKCDLREGKECWYDASYSAGDVVFAKLLTEGEEAVWTELESWYYATLNRGADDGS